MLISQNVWKKLGMSAKEACQVAVHMYQYTADDEQVQCRINYHATKTK